MNLFQRGNYLLHSGYRSSWKIECDALTYEDWSTLAYLIQQRTGPFSAVEGVPDGGVPLAACLEPYCVERGPLLIVDDVWTSGASMEKHRHGRQAIGAVVFARGSALLPWVIALFQLSSCSLMERAPVS